MVDSVLPKKTGSDVSLKRYEYYAQEIAALIQAQTLRPGDRLPSVRQASASRKISPATVFAAYYLLEARGWSRPCARKACGST